MFPTASLFGGREHAFHVGGRNVRPGISDTPAELIVLAAIPFGIRHESEAFLKAEL